MYKDKQRAVQRNWVRQKRTEQKGSTIIKADSNVDASDISIVKALHQVIPYHTPEVIPEGGQVFVFDRAESFSSKTRLEPLTKDNDAQG